MLPPLDLWMESDGHIQLSIDLGPEISLRRRVTTGTAHHADTCSDTFVLRHVPPAATLVRCPPITWAWKAPRLRLRAADMIA